MRKYLSLLSYIGGCLYHVIHLYPGFCDTLPYPKTDPPVTLVREIDLPTSAKLW